MADIVPISSRIITQSRPETGGNVNLETLKTYGPFNNYNSIMQNTNAIGRCCIRKLRDKLKRKRKLYSGNARLASYYI